MADPIDGADALPIVRRTVIAAVVAAIAFGLFFVASTQVGSIRAESPWNADPWAGVIWFTAQLVAGAAIVTALRCVPLILGDGDLVLMRRVLRGIDLVVGAIALTVLAAVTALADRVRAVSAGNATPWLVDLLIVVAVATAVSIMSQYFAWRAIGRTSSANASEAADPVRLLAAWVLDRAPAPFDRPVVVVAAFSVAVGAAVSLWHTVVEGVLTSGFGVALAVTMLVASIEALGVFVIGWGSARYLEIFPPRASAGA